MDHTRLNITQKMVLREKIKWQFLILFSLFTCSTFGATNKQDSIFELLMTVNKNWGEISTPYSHVNTPNSEQELVELHLLNVIDYLETRSTVTYTLQQIENRKLNISYLRKYVAVGQFPQNNITSFRTPIFIDSENTHCAVGFLLLKNGLGQVAQEIAEKQLLCYLKDISHPQLTTWQKTCGLTLFELALIQPTYGPPIPVCASPSSVHWEAVTTESTITKLYSDEKKNALYGIANIGELGLQQEIKTYNADTKQWSRCGNQINGEILEITFHKGSLYLSVLLPDEKYPHQLLKQNGDKWEKVAHFNGSVISVQAFQNKLFVLGNFTLVNDSISGKLVEIEGKSIKQFNPKGSLYPHIDNMKSSETCLFFTGGGAIYKFKNDSIKYLTSIQYYSYIKNISLDAVADTLIVTSHDLQGCNKYYDHIEHPTYINNALYGQDSPYSYPSFTKSQQIKGKMLLAGDFKTSTLIPQINDERHLVECPAEQSANWFGEGLLYQYKNMCYPILSEGIVLDFAQLNDQIYILKNDGNISFVSIRDIDKEIVALRAKNGL